MRRIGISVLSMAICTSALADARLPVVNIGGNAVSARAAFGVGADSKSQKSVKKTVVARASVADKNRVARVHKQDADPIPPADQGARIAANSSVMDVLVPHRPSGDLWARTDTPLRMPTPQEFSVIRSDAELPEESLDQPRIATVRDVAPAPLSQSVGMGALDAEIEKLVDAARRAETTSTVAAVRPLPASTTGATTARRVLPRRGGVSSQPVSTPVASMAGHDQSQAGVLADASNDSIITASATSGTTPVAINDASSGAAVVHRMVVPMDTGVTVRPVRTATAPTVMARADTDMATMTPSELKKAFRKTFLSENKHLSTFQIDDRFDVVSDMESQSEGFTAVRDLSEAGGVRPLEIKIKFRGDDASLSRENYNLLTEYASIVLANPKRSVQVSIPESVTHDATARKLAARRLAIVEQVLRDTGVSEHRIMPVLSARDEQGYVLRMISNDQFETLTQKKRDMFGDTVGKKTYKSMSW